MRFAFARLSKGRLLIRRTMMVMGMQELMREVKIFEDYVRACQAGDELRNVPLTREEVDVIASYRRFMSQQEDSSQI
jgi:hypothetical protein